MLRNNENSISFSKPFENVCQICNNKVHEALLCPHTTCIHCKSANHISHHCDSVNNKIELVCKICNKEGHTLNLCKFIENNIYMTHCQYCQIIGHSATQCPDINEYQLGCVYCGNSGHLTKDCLSAVCKNCNRSGHWMKYCPTKVMRRWCATCNEKHLDLSDCNRAKILMMQHKQQILRNTVTCQICDKIGHSAKTCSQQSNFQSNRYSSSNEKYKDWNRSKNEVIPTHHQSNHNLNNQRQNFINTQEIKCEYCYRTGHNINNCREVKNLLMQGKFFNFDDAITENKQEITILEESKTIIMNQNNNNKPEINEIEIADESKVNKLIIKNHKNPNEINLIDFNEIFKNNNEMKNIKETNFI